MKMNDTAILERSQRELASNVLKQAAQDLRRFHDAMSAVERELYFDAYSWLVANDSTRAFSFPNVCRLLNRAPEDVRNELLGDLPLNIFCYWTRRCGRATRWLETSFSRILATERNESAATTVGLVQTSY